VAGIPPDRIRLHLCWGNYDGPHTHDVPLEPLLPIIYRARVGALSLPLASPRHQHELRAFRRHPLPDGMLFLPGVIDSTTNVVEHPEVIADLQRSGWGSGQVGCAEPRTAAVASPMAPTSIEHAAQASCSHDLNRHARFALMRRFGKYSCCATASEKCEGPRKRSSARQGPSATPHSRSPSIKRPSNVCSTFSGGQACSRYPGFRGLIGGYQGSSLRTAERELPWLSGPHDCFAE
jgi:hypothetical protein